MIDKKIVTPALMVKNEEIWLYSVLHDVCEMFERVIVLDTGSTDRTKTIANIFDNVELLTEDFGGDAFQIGNGRNLLRRKVQTHWMFLIDGDEIWTHPQLEKLLNSTIPDDIEVCMAGSHNIQDVDGRLFKRTHDVANKDILMSPNIQWTRMDYPFESYGLGDNLSMERVHYFPAHEVFCWHMRHTRRSFDDNGAFFRKEKYNYFKYDGPFEQLPRGWLTNVSIENPYFREVVSAQE